MPPKPHYVKGTFTAPFPSRDAYYTINSRLLTKLLRSLPIEIHYMNENMQLIFFSFLVYTK